MNNLKTAVILCVFIAIGAFIYFLPTKPRHIAEPPKVTAPKIQKQQGTNTARTPKAATSGSRKQRVRTSLQTDNATWRDAQPEERVRTTSRAAAPAAAGNDDASRAEDQKTQEFDERMAEFKTHYEWDAPATMNLAEHLITVIPEKFRDSGLTATINNLNNAQQQGQYSTVDEAMLLQSIEQTMPEQFRPALRDIVEKYKRDNP